MVRGVRRVTLRRATVATVAAMTIAGLWHGPASTYVAFGLIHGLALVVNQFWRKKVKRNMPTMLSWGLTMGVVLIAFVFFRSPSLGAAGGMLRALFCNPHLVGFDSLRSVIRRTDLMVLGLPIVLALPLALLGPDSNELAQNMIPSRRGMLVAIGAFLCAFLFLNSTLAQDFVYFAF
jgi:D-alanyl-lipoteichoic acid acyltransferase DltB (MBOAT superfamily)